MKQFLTLLVISTLLVSSCQKEISFEGDIIPIIPGTPAGGLLEKVVYKWDANTGELIYGYDSKKQIISKKEIEIEGPQRDEKTSVYTRDAAGKILKVTIKSTGLSQQGIDSVVRNYSRDASGKIVKGIAIYDIGWLQMDSMVVKYDASNMPIQIINYFVDLDVNEIDEILSVKIKYQNGNMIEMAVYQIDPVTGTEVLGTTFTQTFDNKVSPYSNQVDDYIADAVPYLAKNNVAGSKILIASTPPSTITSTYTHTYHSNNLPKDGTVKIVTTEPAQTMNGVFSFFYK